MKARARRPRTNWRGQVTMGVGERLQLVEPESSVLQRVKEALWASGGVEVFRNSVGLARHGSRRVPYGLGVGSADLVCIVAPYGRWLCLETKRPKNAKESVEQEKWLAKVRLYGAVAGFVRSPEEALALLAEARSPIE